MNVSQMQSKRVLVVSAAVCPLVLVSIWSIWKWGVARDAEGWVAALGLLGLMILYRRLAELRSRHARAALVGGALGIIIVGAVLGILFLTLPYEDVRLAVGFSSESSR